MEISMEKQNIIELRNAAKYYWMGENIVKALDELGLLGARRRVETLKSLRRG